jgi:hypothetical protein
VHWLGSPPSSLPHIYLPHTYNNCKRSHCFTSYIHTKHLDHGWVGRGASDAQQSLVQLLEMGNIETDWMKSM